MALIVADILSDLFFQVVPSDRITLVGKSQQIYYGPPELILDNDL